MRLPPESARLKERGVSGVLHTSVDKQDNIVGAYHILLTYLRRYVVTILKLPMTRPSIYDVQSHVHGSLCRQSLLRPPPRGSNITCDRKRPTNGRVWTCDCLAANPPSPQRPDFFAWLFCTKLGGGSAFFATSGDQSAGASSLSMVVQTWSKFQTNQPVDGLPPASSAA